MFPFQPFALRKTVAETANVDLDDTLRTKRALNRLGYYEPPKSHGKSIGITEFPDIDLFQALRRFQEDQGLKRDGVMKPGGPTAIRLGRVLNQHLGPQRPLNTLSPDPNPGLRKTGRSTAHPGQTAFPGMGAPSKNEEAEAETEPEQHKNCDDLKNALLDAKTDHAAAREAHQRMVDTVNHTLDRMEQLRNEISDLQLEGVGQFLTNVPLGRLLKRLSGARSKPVNVDHPQPDMIGMQIMARREELRTLENSLAVFVRERDKLAIRRDRTREAWIEAQQAWDRSECG